MKKLLTTMSAVVAAMSLFATDSGALSGTSFEGLAAGPYSITAKGIANGGELGEGFIDGTTTYWVTNETATLEVVGERSSAATRPEAFDSYNQESYLSIKTTLGNPVSRYVNSDRETAVAIAGGLYFDSLVKFTAFDSDPTIELGTDGKLAIWLKEVYGANDNEPPTGTNLVVTAGYVDGNGDATTTNYVCSIAGDNSGILNDGGWHRVTVRMINSIFDGSTTPGFVIAIDEHRVVNGETKFVVPGGASLTSVAAAFDAEGSLFPSALQSGTAAATSISAVSFDGQGCVDDVVFTRTQPTCVKDPDVFTITIGENVASAKYALNGSESPVTITNAIGSGTVSVTVPLAAGTYFTISDVIPASGYMEDTYEIVGNMTFDGSVYAPSANSELIIKAKSLGAYVNGVPYETLTAAIVAANESSSDCTVRLAANADAGITIENELGATITLDLAGNDITGEDGVEGPAIYVVAGTLIVTNSTPSDIGVVTPGTFEAALNAAVNYDDENATVIIQDGIYNGFVNAASISGGKFLASENTQQELNDMIVDGYEATQVGDYYELTEKAQTYTIKFVYGENGATTNTQSVASGSMPTEPTAQEVAVEGKTFTGWDSTVVVAAADATYTAQYTVNSYTITFVYGLTGQSQYQQSYNYGLVPEIPGDAAITGYDLSWSPAIEAVKSNTTYTAEYTAVDYTITYMYGESTLTGLTPATYTVADAVTLPTEVNLGVVGVSFEAWTNANGDVVADWEAGDKTGNQTFYAQTAAVVPTAIDPEGGTVEVTVTAESEAAAIAGVLVTPPTGSGADAAEYKALFNFTAVETSSGSGEYTVTLTGIKSDVVTGVDTSAVTLLKSSASTGTITVPAGLYYRITPSTALPISGTPVSGLSTGASETVTKPGTTKGFYKIELSAVPFAVPNS